MIEVVLTDGTSGRPIWMDVSNPSEEELVNLREEYRLHSTLLDDSVEHGHLPKYEVVEGTTLIIIRAFDETSAPDGSSVTAITRKIALFLGEQFLITVHRDDQPYLRALRERYRSAPPRSAHLQLVLLEIILDAVETYSKLLEDAEAQVERFEEAVLTNRFSEAEWSHVFLTKCRLSVTKRMLWHSLNAVQNFHPHSSGDLPLSQDVRERVESLVFFADGLLDDLNTLQNLHLSVSSHRMAQSSYRTNEVVKLLTLFSMFFLPLNFLVGVYGMNFEFMPELKWKYGYALVWLAICAIVLSIYGWFRRKGWLRNSD